MWRRSSLLKTQINAVAERKPDKNQKFRLAGIQTLTSAIPVQCSNQYVLYCYWTVSNTSRILCILKIPPHIYSVRIQNTFGKIRVVYIHISKRAVNFAKFLVMETR